MKYLLTAAIVLAATATAQQTVLDFEDLVGFAPMPVPYGGVADWGSWAHSDTVDPNYPPASGVVRVFSVGGQRPIVFGRDVIFEGANVVSALPFSWKLFYQGQEVHTSTILSPNTGGPAVWLPSGYTGLVDSMEYISAVNVHSVDDFTYTDPAATIGDEYCGPAVPNSSGLSASLAASGTAVAADNDLTLTAMDLPPNAFGFFLVSQTQGFVMNPGGSSGNLCLAGMVGRYVGPGQIQNSGAARSMSLTLDLIQTPQPTGFVSIVLGETWNFQTWFRDSGAGGATSNFTQALEVTFL
ncbi:MAG: hypothetical protein ACJA0P_002749 [Planctomycetota bacterium]|jgi:hypothetical protein